ncbi:S-layer homology domain-containing protein [Cohnella faecalis]|nr:S-layer homology domain-containing protein [Cohnella faecalis]
MQRIKRPLVWLMMTLLLVSLFPSELAQRANAASAATYFIPDITQIRQSALYTMDSSGTIITRDNVYKTTNGALTITGTFSYVSKDTMKVKVEQLNYQSNKWVPDATRVVNAAVLAQDGTTNRFAANNLALFSGFNRITFSGMQGGIERSDTFFVLYDKVPFLTALKVVGGGPSEINLNEGSQAVVEKSTVSLQGVAQNATKVTVALNGGTAAITSLLEDGTFFSPALNLRSGVNSLNINVQNGSDSINVLRTIYYFDKDNPLTKLEIVHSSGEYPALGTIPTITEFGSSFALKAQLLVPYDDAPFDGTAIYSFQLKGDSSADIVTDTVTVDEAEIIIPGPDGVTPKYRLVTFTTADHPYDDSVLNQEATLSVTYGTFGTAKTAKFKSMPGNTLISAMYYLPDFDESTNTDVSSQTQVPLKGAQVGKSDFYILVKADKAPSTGLDGVYLPLSTTAINLTQVSGATVPDPVYEVYKISGFLNGQQKVQFSYSAGANYIADITYISQNYIYVADIYDGQTYEFDSRLESSLKISGEFIGFENFTSDPEYFVNGTVPTDSPDIDLTEDFDPAANSYKFQLELDIKPEGPLVYGENRIVFVARTDGGSGGVVREVRKEIKIYITDKNVSKIAKFMPAPVPVDTRPEFVLQDFASPSTDVLYNDLISKLFAASTDFAFKNDKYVTSRTTYDLVIRGSGASVLNLKLGSETILNLSIPKEEDEDGVGGIEKLIKLREFTMNDKKYYYDFSGDERDFIVRVRDLEFPEPGSHVYNLELINGTGARSTQRLEVARELSSYLLLAPQPTVGDQIIVNKNFVRFDIEAEGATAVFIDKYQAVEQPNSRFTFDYSDLKANKVTAIKIRVVRPSQTINDTVSVMYTNSIQIDSQYMEPLKTKHSIFNKQIELTFPKGTILKSAYQNGSGITKFYTETKLLFGIADPTDGVVERRNDYGHIINNGVSTVTIQDYLVSRFRSSANTQNFTTISNIFWINGGEGELGDKGTSGYIPATNGLAPYSTEGNFTEFPLERKVVPSNRGELTLSYNSNVVDEIGYTVSVFRYTDRGVWENIGGEVNTKNHTITVPFDDFGYYMVTKLKRGYNDITNHPWARNVLNALYSKGIMNNLRFDEFGADDQTTRGEFATLLVKGLNIPLNYDDKNTFFDILPGTSTTTWSYEYIETAARAGIVMGKSEGFFSAGTRVTRQEAAVMIARALKLKLSLNDKKLEAKLAKSFVDSSRIDFYARPAAEAVNKAKIMMGSEVTVAGQKKPVYNFNAEANLTRAEAGQIAVKMLQLKTNIFPKNLG